MRVEVQGTRDHGVLCAMLKNLTLILMDLKMITCKFETHHLCKKFPLDDLEQVAKYL